MIEYTEAQLKGITMSIIIIEVPHQRSPRVWVAKDEQSIIQMAVKVENFAYEEWTMETAADCFDKDDIPRDLELILSEHGKAICTGYCQESEFYAPKDAPTEIEAAKEAIGHDLNTCYFLTVTEAKEFKGNADVEIALNKFIEENDYLFGGDE